MRLLAIDTACASCSAALWFNGVVVSSRLNAMYRGQAEALMPMVGDVMHEAQTHFELLDLIAVTIGPGSFTGLRTGFAAARGFALALGIPLIGTTTTEAIALAAHHLTPYNEVKRPITVILNSRRRDLYVQHFSARLTPVGAPFTALPEEIVRETLEGGVIFAGDATTEIMDFIQTQTERGQFSVFPVSGPDAKFVAEIAANRWNNCSMQENYFPDKLLYLRASEAIQPVAQGRLRR